MHIGLDNIHEYEKTLAKHLFSGLQEIDGLNAYGPLDPEKQGPVVACSIKGISAHDIAIILDETANIFLRSGMHCAHYFHQNVIHETEGTLRPSLYFYNTEEEIDTFISTLSEIVKTFGK